MVATSGNTNYSTTRDAIIARALRIIGAIGQGETPTTTAVTEASEALNDLVKEWQADGMPLWAIRNYKITPKSGVTEYDISDPPLKIFQAWYRNNTTLNDTPMLILTRQEYEMLGSKTGAGAPTQVWYNAPGNMTMTGEARFYVTPDSTFASNSTIWLTGQRQFEDFDASTDLPDFPQYWYNAVKWGLADQLAYEYGVGITERSMITKKALIHKEAALNFGIEEGSLFFQPKNII